MKNILIKILSILIVFIITLPAVIARAQSEVAAGPVYIVQEGDSLWEIAYRFHVSQQDLASANGIVNSDQIVSGQPLLIPGLEGIQGVLTTEKVPFGETLQSLSFRYHLSLSMLQRLNHLTSPNELYAGFSLVILQENNPSSLGKRATLEPGQSLLEFAVLNETDPWTLLSGNQLDSTSLILPNDVLRVPGEDDLGPGGLPPEITSVDISGLIQGETAELDLKGSDGLSISGSLTDHPLNFFSNAQGNYVALQGIHAMIEPGLYPLELTTSMPNGSTVKYSQSVFISKGDYIYDLPLSVDPATLDPETTVPEDQQWMSLAAQVSQEKLWEGVFMLPVDPIFAGCYPSRFGSRRSYNGSEYTYFHTGLDFCSQIGNPIYSAAPGVVVFTGELTVRGKATMIDHGHGIFTAYMHQSEILVNLGDKVEAGQLIGRVGNTGRVEGPHLHFEVIVGGVQVNPVDWLDRAFP